MSSMQVIMRMGRRSGGSLGTAGGTRNHHPCRPPSSWDATSGRRGTPGPPRELIDAKDMIDG
jgi:hypothetical protein